MTDAEIITEAESLTRVNTGIAVTSYAAWLNRIMKRYCRLKQWPELKVMGATISTVAGTFTYALPAGFDRFAGDYVFYNPTLVSTGVYQSGVPLPILLTGSTADDSKIAFWRQAGQATPQAVTLGISSSALKLFVYPTPDTSSVTLLYDYVKAPTTLTGAGVTIDVQALCGVLTMELCAEILRFSGGQANMQQRQSYLQDARREYNAALSNLLIS